MSLIRFSVLLAVIAVAAFPAAGQVPGDSVVVGGGAIQEEPFITGDTVFRLSRGDTVKVIDAEEDYLEVVYAQTRVRWEGWLRKEDVMSAEERKKYEQELEAERRRAQQRAQQRKEYLGSLREQGYSIALVRQTFSKNTADGISVGLGLVNISQTKTVKYAKITWKLFNSVGESTVGQNSGRSTAKTKLVGPIKPGETGYSEFENVWYNSVGTCAEVRGIVVEHIDGSTFTYINDLKDIAQEADGVRLMGDCSYEAQQERK